MTFADRHAAPDRTRSLRASSIALFHPQMAFDGHDPEIATIGVEEEYLLVDADGTSLAPVAADVLLRLGDARRFTTEYRAAQIEAVTPICTTALDIERELEAGRVAVAEAAQGLALPMAAAIHPMAEPAPVTDGKRYSTITSESPWAARELQTCGMHVHIGIHGADRALAVANALRSYLPLLGAIASNSPFYRGVDAAVASVRARLNTTLPRSGVPPAFATWDDYERYLRWGARGAVIPDPSFHWFDLRLNITHGTIEVRVFDVQTDTRSAAALAALTQALAAWLAWRHDRGEALPVHCDHVIRESAVLAERDGTTGCIVELDTGALVPTYDAVDRLLQQVSEVSRGLSSETLLGEIRSLAAVNGAERQRLVAATRGMDGLCRWLVDGTVARSARETVPR